MVITTPRPSSDAPLSRAQALNQTTPNQYMLNQTTPNQTAPNRTIPNQTISSRTTSNRGTPDRTILNQPIRNQNIPDPIHLTYDNTVYTISHDYYNLVLDYIFHDCTKKSRSIAHFPNITALTPDEFRRRYAVDNERRYRVAVARYAAFRSRHTFALAQPAISSPLDKRVPKPGFGFSRSLLELDHWCQCVVYPCVQEALAVFGIMIDVSSPKQFAASMKVLNEIEITMKEEAEIREIQQTALLNPMEDDENEETTRTGRTRGQRYSYIVTQASDYQNNSRYQRQNHPRYHPQKTHSRHRHQLGSQNQHKRKEGPIYEGTTEIDPESVLPEEEQDPHLEAFCRIVDDGIENLEATTNFIVNLSERHAFLEAFEQCKEDIIQAVLRCIPENECYSGCNNDIDVRNNGNNNIHVHVPSRNNEVSNNNNNNNNQETRTGRLRSSSVASVLSALLSQNEPYYDPDSDYSSDSSSDLSSDSTIFNDTTGPNYRRNRTVTRKYTNNGTSILSYDPYPQHIHNEFTKLFRPSSQATLFTFLETFENCRQHMLCHNNPLHQTNYYLVDAGYLPDPRQQGGTRCRIKRKGSRRRRDKDKKEPRARDRGLLTEPKKKTLKDTVEFHKRLLKKEVELGYHKYIGFSNVLNNGLNNGLGLELGFGISADANQTGRERGREKEENYREVIREEDKEQDQEKINTLANVEGLTRRESMGLDELINDTLACLDNDFEAVFGQDPVIGTEPYQINEKNEFCGQLGFSGDAEYNRASKVNRTSGSDGVNRANRVSEANEPETTKETEAQRQSSALTAAYESLVGRTLSLGSSTLLDRHSTLKLTNPMDKSNSMTQLSPIGQFSPIAAAPLGGPLTQPAAPMAQQGAILQLAIAAQDAQRYERYYSMLAYAIRAHHFPDTQHHVCDRRCDKSYEYPYEDPYKFPCDKHIDPATETAMELVVLLEAFVNGLLSNFELQKLLKLEGFEIEEGREEMALEEKHEGFRPEKKLGGLGQNNCSIAKSLEKKAKPSQVKRKPVNPLSPPSSLDPLSATRKLTASNGLDGSDNPDSFVCSKAANYSESRRKYVDVLIEGKVHEFQRRERDRRRLWRLRQLLATNLGQPAMLGADGSCRPLVSEEFKTDRGYGEEKKSGNEKFGLGRKAFGYEADVPAIIGKEGLYGNVNYDSDQEEKYRKANLGPNNKGMCLFFSEMNEFARKMKKSTQECKLKHVPKTFKRIRHQSEDLTNLEADSGLVISRPLQHFPSTDGASMAGSFPSPNPNNNGYGGYSPIIRKVDHF